MELCRSSSRVCHRRRDVDSCCVSTRAGIAEALDIYHAARLPRELSLGADRPAGHTLARSSISASHSKQLVCVFGFTTSLRRCGNHLVVLHRLGARPRLDSNPKNLVTFVHKSSNQSLEPTAGRRTERLKDEL